jgi:sugar phosphate isomerase/epimerase
MKLALNAQQLAHNHTLPDILDVFEKYGVKALELWPANLPGVSQTPEEQERFETKDIDSVGTLIRTRGFQVACVTLGFHAAPLCIARGGTQNLTEALQGAVDAAVKLECQLVNCYTAHIPLTLFLEAMRPAAAYAATCGVVITLENEAHDESALPQDIARLVQAVNSPGFRTQYDPCNYYHAYVEPFPHAYQILREHMAYVHLKGGCHYVERPGVYQGSLMRHSSQDYIGYVPLRQSAFAIEGIIRELQSDGYKGWVTLEPHVPAEVVPEFYQQDLAYLYSLLKV